MIIQNLIDNLLYVYILLKKIEREGGNGLFITVVPKVLNDVFLFVGLTTLGTLVNFNWLVTYVEYSNISTNNYNL